ncbi:MAG: DUF5686 and carboxypeptidase regulatory-like domain-containing protein [Bacteroidales bacterium]|jgi:hypothetical protein
MLHYIGNQHPLSFSPPAGGEMIYSFPASWRGRLGMGYFIVIALVLLFNSSLSSAQILKGKITSQSGDPIQYATVYIQELRQGTTSNTKGDYEISLPAGKYTVIYQSLGYQPVYINIFLSGEIVLKDVILPLQYYEIPEVRISASGEDPAYIIMRKAIGLAPYYLNNVSYYKAEVYLKGNLVINKIPKLLQKSMKIESSGNETSVSAGSKPGKEEKLLKAGDSFLMESFNEIEFTAPDKYFQRMISYNSTFPSQGNEISPMSFIQASFYQPVLAEMAISPLAPNAFSHYNYKYLGASLQGNFTINKIQVIPKRKSQQLFEGTIYIIEDLWCLQSVDLTNENLVGKVRIQQLYIPVQDEIWMPVSHRFEINIGIIGFKADAGYGSSVKYTEVRPNLSLQKPVILSTDYSNKQGTSQKTYDTIVSKSKQQINTILEKDKLSNRDMAKLARLMEKESEKSVNDSNRKNLEIKDNTTQIVEKDADKRDSSYWARIRPIPLSDIEIRSIKISDSIKSATSAKESKTDTIPAAKKKEKTNFGRAVREIVFGHSWSDTSGFRFTNGGLIDLKSISFNSVDGFNYGLNFSISKSWKKNTTLAFSPDIRYAFSRKQVLWGISTNYQFDKVKHRQLFLRAGAKSKDINNGGGINPFINMFTSLLQKRNYLKLYESRYLTFGYSSEIVNGLTLELSTDYENRRALQNTTNFSFLKSSKVYSDNTPVNSYLSPESNPINALGDLKHLDFISKISYTPFQRYRINKGVKIPVSSDWPTFDLTWQHGINKFSEFTPGLRRFDMFRFEVSRNSSIGAFSNFRWRLRAAGFLDNRDLTFYDFFQINSQPFLLLLNNYEDAFMIPSFYSLATPEFYVETHLKYTTPYLLLKLLPGLSNTLMRENISLSYLGSRFHPNYTEIGYSISEILFLGELGVYCGFDDIRYRSAGVRAVLRLN